MANDVEIGYDLTGNDVYLDFEGFASLYTRTVVGTLQFQGAAFSSNEHSSGLTTLELSGLASPLFTESSFVGALELIPVGIGSPSGTTAVGAISLEPIGVPAANITSTAIESLELSAIAPASNGVGTAVGILEFCSNAVGEQLGLLAPGSAWWEYSFDGTNLHIPLSVLPGLNATSADAITGDWRKIFRALLFSINQYELLFKPGTQSFGYHSWVTAVPREHPLLNDVVRHRFYTRINLGQIDETTLKEEQ